MRRLLTLAPALAVALAAAIAPSAALAGSYTYARPGAGAAAQQVDVDACSVQGAQRALAASAAHRPAAMYATSLAGMAAVALLDGAIQGVHTARERERGVDGCMRARGWTRLDLTPDETASLRGAAGAPARARWMDAFLAGDLSDRMTAASAAMIQPLPTLKPEPLAHGLARIDPDSLRAAPAPVDKGGLLVTGSAAHRATGALAKPFEARVGGFLAAAPAGTPVFALEERGSPDPEEGLSSFWCFQQSAKTMMASGQGVVCVASTAEEYRSFGGGRLAWAAARDAGRPLISLKKTAVVVTRDTVDTIGPMGFELKLLDVNGKVAKLEAAVTRDSDRAPIWRGEVRFDADGRAVVPFWTARLVLTRSGKAVTAAWSPDGDGRGWSALSGD